MSEPAIGSEVGNCRIVAQLGKGAFGTVYRAENRVLNREVAIKVLPRTLVVDDKDTVKRFLREARTAAQLDHPNVVTVYKLGRDKDWYYIEMQMVEGQTLTQLVEQRGRLAVKEATRIVRLIAEALHFAHQRNVVHRDVKAANVLVTSDGRVMVSDFGLAKCLADASGSAGTTGIVGTPLYMAPELAEGMPADARSDIYALGITLYYLLTGTHPFTGRRAVEIVRRHQTEELTPPSAHNPEVSEPVSDIVARMTAKKPEERYQNVAQLISDLDAIGGKFGPCIVRLLGTDEIRVLPLADFTASIGRDDANTICLKDTEVSARHAEVVPVADGHRLRDLNSTNGTQVNGERIGEKLLVTGDLICAGTCVLIFIGADAQAAKPPASGYQLTGLSRARTGESWPLRSGPFLIGRHGATHLVLSDGAVSDFHAQIVTSEDAVTLTDLKSCTGVRVNGQQVVRTTLAPGDTLSIGDSEFRFEEAAADASPRSGSSAPSESVGLPSMDTTARRNALTEEAQRLQPDEARLQGEPHSETGLSGLRLTCIAGSAKGKHWPIGTGRVVIGRDPAATIAIDDRDASWRHAEVRPVRGKAVLRDLDSRFGTRLNGMRMDSRELMPDDVIQIGHTRFLVEATGES